MRAEPRGRLFEFAPRFRPGPAIRKALGALAVLGAVAATTRGAAAFCRTTSCPLPAGFTPTDGQCVPPGFDAYCASMDPPVTNLPVFWSNACVSYDIQQTASKQVPYAKAVSLFADAFAKWTSTTCASQGKGRVSIETKNLGPVICNKVQYSSDQGNQHVIIFYDDDTWPYDDTANTLGLTTITFNPDTGEIYDADMAINSGTNVPLSLGDPVPAEGYDFQSIITHETGHFLGMAHSADEQATMFYRYMQGSTTMRTLSPDDTAGICSIYLANGDRAVGKSVAASGTVVGGSCDPTPRHGFQSVCAQSLGCAVSGLAGRGAPGSAALAAAALALAASVRRRARPPRM
jgi:Matrixin